MYLPEPFSIIAQFLYDAAMSSPPLLILALGKSLTRFPKLLSTKVIALLMSAGIAFSLRQIALGPSMLIAREKEGWAWKVGYLVLGLTVLLYTREHKNFGKLESLQLSTCSIWGAAFMKELAWYILYFEGWFLAERDWLTYTGIITLVFHVSCISSATFFVYKLSRLGWHPSRKWAALFITLLLFELFVMEPACRLDYAFHTSILAGFHRLPWFGLLLLTVVETPEKRQIGERFDCG